MYMRRPFSSADCGTGQRKAKVTGKVLLSPRPADWSLYLREAPVASEAFMNDVTDLRLQGRKAIVKKRVPARPQSGD